MRKVERADTIVVNYSYLADGTKAAAEREDGSGLVYRGSLTYRKDSTGVLTLESAPSPTGRITPSGMRYHVTDHLGSVRAVIDGQSGAILEAGNYAVYGWRSTAYTNTWPTTTATAGETLRDHFSGKEDQAPDFHLSITDFGARPYSPSLHRWLTPDPLAEKYYDVSPYAYCAGDPVNLVDPVGMELSDYYSLNGKKLLHIEDGDDKRYFVLSGNNVEQAISTGNIAPVPSNEVLKKMDAAISDTSESGKENYFRVGDNGEVSITVRGDETSVSNDKIQLTVQDLRDNKHTYVAYDIHTHPKSSQGSTNIPSPIDVENVVGHFPSIVLGYQTTIFNSIDDMGHKNISTIFTPQVTYYYKNGIVNGPIDYSKYKRVIKRINK